MVSGPIHPIFVHFTIGLLGIFIFLTIICVFLPKTKLKEDLATTKRWCLWLGLGFTFFTIATGFWSYFKVDHIEGSHKFMIIHRNWALASFFVFGALTLWSIISYFKNHDSKFPFLIVSIIAGILLLIAGYFGGKLVYDFGVGISSNLLKKEYSLQHSH